MVRMSVSSMRTPEDDELMNAVKSIMPSTRTPFVGTKKIIETLRRSHPGWRITERRLKKLRSTEDESLAQWCMVSLSDNESDQEDMDDYVIVTAKDC